MRKKSHCALIFDGHDLDYEINNFMTVNVEGRQLFAPVVETVNIKGRDGDVIIGQRYPARDITVHFLLHETKNAFWLENIKRLTEILQTDSDVEFSFLDESGVRFGRVIDYDDPPYDQNMGMGKFTIHCSDPFLYSHIKKSTGKISRLKYRKYPVRVESITVTVPTAQKVVIKNITRGTSIILNGSFTEGQKLVITKDKITVNEQNRMMWLDFAESDYHGFKVYSEDEIVVSPSANIEIKYRERVL